MIYQELKNNPDYVVSMVREALSVFFHPVPYLKRGTWTTTENQETWCLEFYHFVLYPHRVLRPSIAGERWFDGWRVERVWVDDNGADSRPDFDAVSLGDVIGYVVSEWVADAVGEAVRSQADNNPVPA